MLLTIGNIIVDAIFVNVTEYKLCVRQQSIKHNSYFSTLLFRPAKQTHTNRPLVNTQFGISLFKINIYYIGILLRYFLFSYIIIYPFDATLLIHVNKRINREFYMYAKKWIMIRREIKRHTRVSAFHPEGTYLQSTFHQHVMYFYTKNNYI